MKKFLLIHGPNLNLLGQREPELYGTQTLLMLENNLHEYLKDRAALEAFQSNHEGDLIDSIQKARNNTDGIIINAGAYSHTSIALLDALNAYHPPVVEVHLTNIFQRESFRQHTFIALRANAVIAGLGQQGYQAAADYLLSL